MYCGCKTLCSKITWFSALLLILISSGLWIVFKVEGDKCELCDKSSNGSSESDVRNCRALDSDEFDSDVHVLRGCNTALVTGTYFAGIVSLILALLPFFSMCCCVAAPVKEHKEDQDSAPATLSSQDFDAVPELEVELSVPSAFAPTVAATGGFIPVQKPTDEGIQIQEHQPPDTLGRAG